ncbi:hypothetical protein L7F22_050800 [Adiantum nelumboides]|nr:hypothetical protein [Adiantum nelumboides]
MDMTGRTDGNFGSGMPLLNAPVYDNLTPKGKPKDYKEGGQAVRVFKDTKGCHFFENQCASMDFIVELGCGTSTWVQFKQIFAPAWINSTFEVIAANFYAEKQVEHKGQVDLVTETDKACEKLAFEHIGKIFPNHKFIGEETAALFGSFELTDAPTWIIDPLDGTTNFVHSCPMATLALWDMHTYISRLLNEAVLQDGHEMILSIASLTEEVLSVRPKILPEHGVCISIGPRLLSSIRHHGTLVAGRALYVAIDIVGTLVGFLSVYAHNTRRVRATFWSQLTDEFPIVDTWIIGGDFNNIESDTDCCAQTRPVLSSISPHEQEEWDRSLLATHTADAWLTPSFGQRRGSLSYSWGFRGQLRLLERLDRFYVGAWAAARGGLTAIWAGMVLSDHRPVSMFISFGAPEAPRRGAKIPDRILSDQDLLLQLQRIWSMDLVSSSTPTNFPALRITDSNFLRAQQPALRCLLMLVVDEPDLLDQEYVDDTLLFLRFPFVCISIGLTIEKVPVVGVVYNPILDELFTAVKNKGAFLNGVPIKASSQENIGSALLASEVGIKRDKLSVDATTNRINSLLYKVRSLRMTGSCALNLCGIACGRLDIFYELGYGGPWDVAAGVVIVQEAGGQIFSPSGEEFDITTQRIAASNSFLKDSFVKALKESNAL